MTLERSILVEQKNLRRAQAAIGRGKNRRRHLERAAAAERMLAVLEQVKRLPGM